MFYYFADAIGEVGCDGDSTVHWCFSRYIDILWVQFVLTGCPISSCGWDLEVETSVVVLCWANIPSVDSSRAPGCAIFRWIEDGAFGSWWGVWDAIKIVRSLEDVVSGQFWMYAGCA